MRYMLCVSCVDGETDYGISGYDRASVLIFLADHDHEGSSIYLRITNDDGVVEEHYDAEAIYKILGAI